MQLHSWDVKPQLSCASLAALSSLAMKPQLGCDQLLGCEAALSVQPRLWSERDGLHRGSVWIHLADMAETVFVSDKRAL